MSILSKIKERQDLLIREGKERAMAEYSYILSEYKGVIENEDKLNSILEVNPFAPEVVIKVRDEGILSDRVAYSEIHTKLSERYKMYHTDGLFWYIGIVELYRPISEPPKVIGESKVKESTNESVNDITLAQINETLKKTIQERNSLKSKLSELSFENEIIRQETDTKIKALEEENQKRINDIFREIRDHHQRVSLNQVQLLQNQDKQVKEIEEQYELEKKHNTLRIEEMQALIRSMMEKEKVQPITASEPVQPSLPPNPPKFRPTVGRVPKPLLKSGSIGRTEKR
jgi:hypothetical protein